MEEFWTLYEQVSSFLGQSITLYQAGEEGIQIVLSPGRFLLIVLYLLLGIICTRFLVRALSQSEIFQKMMDDDSKRKFLLKILKGFIYLIVLSLALFTIGIHPSFLFNGINAFLNYPIIKPTEKIEFTLSRIFLIILFLYLGRLSVKFFTTFFDRSEATKKIVNDFGRRKAIIQIVSYIIYAFAIIISMSFIGFEPTLLLTSATALLVGVGLALQHTIDDVFSGIMLLFEGTIEVGDVVEIKDLDIEGRVKEIRLRTSIIETKDSVSIIIPNSNLTSNSVINWNFNDRETRFRVKIGVAYGSDIDRVRKALLHCAENHGLVMKKPGPSVLFKEFGDSSLNFELLFWTAQAFETEKIKSDLLFSIEAEFRRAEIIIPFPQRDLHIVSDFRVSNGKPKEGPVIQEQSPTDL